MKLHAGQGTLGPLVTHWFSNRGADQITQTLYVFVITPLNVYKPIRHLLLFTLSPNDRTEYASRRILLYPYMHL